MDFIQPHDLDFAAVAPQHIQNEFDGGCLAGAVWPDQPHNISLRQGEADIVKLETVKGFRQVFHL